MEEIKTFTALVPFREYVSKHELILKDKVCLIVNNQIVPKQKSELEYFIVDSVLSTDQILVYSIKDSKTIFRTINTNANNMLFVVCDCVRIKDVPKPNVIEQELPFKK